LALSLFLPSKKKGGSENRVGFASGLILQFLNPKGILYGITIFASFSSLLTGRITKTVVSALALTALAFASITTWALVGSALSRWFSDRRVSFAFSEVEEVLPKILHHRELRVAISEPIVDHGLLYVAVLFVKPNSAFVLPGDQQNDLRTEGAAWSLPR